jgi:hypothetical protein
MEQIRARRTPAKPGYPRLSNKERDMAYEGEEATEAVGATTAAQAVFYNMTGEDVQMQVNNQFSTMETVSAIPATSPYTPNHNANTYTRVNISEPQVNQFGTVNTLVYQALGGLGLEIQVTIDVDGTTYPVTQPLLIFMFSTAVVVVCPSDSVPYMGHTGDTIQVKPGATDSL